MKAQESQNGMAIRCPQCKFTGKLADQSRLITDQYLLCPRCHTRISVQELKDSSIDPTFKTDLQYKQPHKLHWETRSSWLDIVAFWRTSSDILFHPSATFTAVNYSGGIRASLIFALVYGSLGQLLARYWFTLLGIHYGILEGDAVTNALRFAGVALSAPISVFIFVFVTACLAHIFLKLLFAAKRPFSATVQVVAYGSGAAPLFNVIPILGSLLVPVWALAIWCIGLAKAHQTSKIRTFLALFLPFVLTGLLVAGVIFVIAAKGVMEVLRTIHLNV